MIAVIFEVKPKAAHKKAYLNIAAELKPILENIEGFISVERFQSLADSKKLLSLSFFEDEASIHRWRSLERHRHAQVAGRESVFDDYRLRVAGVIRDYGLNDREQAPKDSQDVHTT